MASVYYAEGAYVAEIKEQALGETKTGKPQFVLRIKILGTPTDDGSYIPDRPQYDRTIYMVITEGTMPYVAEKLQRLGYTGKSFGPLDPASSQHQSFVGNQIDVWCKHDADQSGNPREKWDISRGPSAMKIEPLAPKKVRELDALFGKSLASPATAPVPRQNTTAAALAETEITDDDIPF